MKSNKLILVLALSSLFGCAAMQEQYVRTTCNAEGARQLGYNHARAGQELQPDFVTMCPDHQDELLLKAYREGYESTPKPIFRCEATVNGLIYEGSGSSELEARTRLNEQCSMSSVIHDCLHVTHCSQRQ